MITKTKFIDCILERNIYTYNQETDILTSIEDGHKINADQLLDMYKKKIGQSFEGIYSEDAFCFCVIKCTECGTYIFEHYDEDYESNLKCPVCTDYKTRFKYYTTKDIEDDEDKRKEIEMYIEFTRINKEVNQRYIKRGNLHDWQKTHKKVLFNSKTKKIDIQLIGFDKWDLRAEINIWKRRNDISYFCKHHVKIPISPKTIWFFIKYRTPCIVTWKD